MLFSTFRTTFLQIILVLNISLNLLLREHMRAIQRTHSRRTSQQLRPPAPFCVPNGQQLWRIKAFIWQCALQKTVFICTHVSDTDALSGCLRSGQNYSEWHAITSSAHSITCERDVHNKVSRTVRWVPENGSASCKGCCTSVGTGTV